jgi:hypothetical protein
MSGRDLSKWRRPDPSPGKGESSPGKGEPASGEGEPPAGEDSLEQGSRRPPFRWRVPRSVAATVGIAALLAAFAAGYIAGGRHTRHGGAPLPEPTPVSIRMPHMPGVMRLGQGSDLCSTSPGTPGPILLPSSPSAWPDSSTVYAFSNSPGSVTYYMCPDSK